MLNLSKKLCYLNSLVQTRQNSKELTTDLQKPLWSNIENWFAIISFFVSLHFLSLFGFVTNTLAEKLQINMHNGLTSFCYPFCHNICVLYTDGMKLPLFKTYFLNEVYGMSYWPGSYMVGFQAHVLKGNKAFVYNLLSFLWSYCRA